MKPTYRNLSARNPFDLWALLEDQMRSVKLKGPYNSVLIGPRGLQCESNQPIGNHGLGIFCCGQIWPWAPPSRSNEDSQT